MFPQESRGSLYAYELRGGSMMNNRIRSTKSDVPADLNTQDTVYFKVGRTDNVPRRMGEWATRESFSHQIRGADAAKAANRINPPSATYFPSLPLTRRVRLK